jgi:hypothetical protein
MMKNPSIAALILGLAAGLLFADVYSEEPAADTWTWAGNGSYQSFRSRESANNMPYLEADYTIPGALETTNFGAIKALFR